MSYNSISLKKLYITAAVLCGVYIVLSVLSYILSGTIAESIVSESVKAAHPEMMISGKSKVFLCLAQLVWLPLLIYIISCVDWAFSAKRCKRTLKAAPLLWLVGFFGEHVIASLVSGSELTYASENWLIQRTEYITFFLGIFHIAAIVLVCVAAALGIDEVRHVKHLKYK